MKYLITLEKHEATRWRAECRDAGGKLIACVDGASVPTVIRNLSCALADAQHDGRAKKNPNVAVKRFREGLEAGEKS